jgi:ferredoxin-type protein NapH
MKPGCTGEETKKRASLPVLRSSTQEQPIRKSRTARWRAVALIALNLLMIAHIIQWRITGSTVSPIEPSETMYTLQRGAVNAGLVFFTLAIIATLIFGRFVCGWGCHIVALQDFCAWLLKKLGMVPKPFRSRLLVYVPLVAALYMFVWPTVLHAIIKPVEAPLFPTFTNHLVTENFWETFPPVAVAIPFLFICGFMTVYFLGSKGFCTYACPYGGFFSLADKVAPGRIRVTDACNECGHCTATCTSNVLVHAEVKQFGMVVDPGCMKCMDCISVCPNDALYFGFGKLPSLVSQTDASRKRYSLTWPEEIAAVLIFLLSYLAVWDVYQLVPMLMALGCATVSTFLALKIWRLFTEKQSTFYRFSLKTSGKIKLAGIVFIAFGVVWLGLSAHSGWVRYHEYMGNRAFQQLQIPDELALAQTDPSVWLKADEREIVADGRKHLDNASRYGLFINSFTLPKLAWFAFLSGETERAVSLLNEAASRQHDQSKALSLYYRGAILNRLGRYDAALVSLNSALTERPDLIIAREEAGESLWQLGRREEAVTAWTNAVALNPQLVLAQYQLAGALAELGEPDEAAKYKQQADQSIPKNAYYHWMVGLRLQNLKMNELAEVHFQRAIQLDPAFVLRRPAQPQRR